MTAPATPAAREAGRRALHVASGLLGVGAALLSHPVVTLLLAGLVALALALEGLRLATVPGRAAIHGRFGSLFRAAESRRLSGATLLVASYFAAWLLFPAAAAARAMVVTALADPAAAAVGSRFSGRLGRKSVSGSAAALGVALAALLLWPTAPLPALAAAVTAAAAERVPGPGLDNVLMPLATAGVLALLL